MITSSVRFTKSIFPCKEPHVRIESNKHDCFYDIEWDWGGPEEIIDLMLLVDAARNRGMHLANLSIPYIPFSRQDRIANPGEPLSIKVIANLINSFGAAHVKTVDPHSDVTSALIDNISITTQDQVFAHVFGGVTRPFWLISPDAGALKKINKLAALTKPLAVVECSKNRNTETGEIINTIVHAESLGAYDCYIVDDICDGGRTFTEIAKVLREICEGQIHLLVSHGFFTQGLSVFDGLIDHIWTRKGKIK